MSSQGMHILTGNGGLPHGEHIQFSARSKFLGGKGVVYGEGVAVKGA